MASLTLRHQGVLLLLSVLVIGCSASAPRMLDREPAVYPIPPDPPRIVHVTSFSSDHELFGSQRGFLSALLGPEEAKGINRPYGLTVSNRKLYICDLRLPGIVIVDPAEESFEYFTPRGEAELRKPVNCTIGASGRLYVTDTDRMQVVAYNTDLSFAGVLYGDGKGKPIDVFSHGDRIYVADLELHSVSVFSEEDWSLLMTIREDSSSARGYLYGPTNIWVDDARIYVSDIGDQNIKIFNQQGDYLSAIGSLGMQAGQFTRPKGVSADMYGNVYVVDAAFENVQIFDPDGVLLLAFGGPYHGPGDMWLPAKVITDASLLSYFQQFVGSRYPLSFLIFVTNQYGPDKISVYGFLKKDPA
ncbi:MAG: hypothetical protein IH600_09490 [Bacteroidetes bacterium]|nr:hypothetical protein [Bacteroidota bacterium]